MSLEIVTSEKCGCNNTATKPISKTASTIRTIQFQRPTPINVWSKISLIAVVLIMTQLILSIGEVDAMRVRPRQLRKRHSNMNANLDWENPCGGMHKGTHSGELKQRKASLKLLLLVTNDLYNTMITNDKQIIKTGDIEQWSAYNGSYKFLPKLKNNSKISLRRWHKQMQTYVASFSYLHNKSRKFDEARNNNQLSELSKELKELFLNARQVLCEIESSINRTISQDSPNKLASHISKDQMQDRLKFRTKLINIPEKDDNENNFDFTQDLKFTKFYFTKFLSNMQDILERNIRKKHNHSKSISASSSESGNVSWSSAQDNSNEINAAFSERRHAKKTNRQKNKLRKALQKNSSTPSIALALA